MKVFRISGRDLGFTGALGAAGLGLNESLPHKRKRLITATMWLDKASGLNESLPHKRKRLEHHTDVSVVELRLNESLPHKRKRPTILFCSIQVFMLASMKVFRISGRDPGGYAPAPARHRDASMKVFRISGRDSFEFLIALNCQNCKLSERKANNSLCISQCTRTYSKKSKLDMDFCCSERHPGFP